MREWVDHTAEVELRIEADSVENVFREVVAGLGELLTARPLGPLEESDLHVTATDQPALLVETLNDVIFRAETQHVVPSELRVVRVSETELVARLVGARGRPRPLVKAATYHRLSFAEEAGRWRATVVFDV